MYRNQSHVPIYKSKDYKSRKNIIRLCEFSSTVFGGFQCSIDIKGVESIDEVVVLAISQLRDIMQRNRLYELVKKVDETRWHIHSHTFEDIVRTDIIWICDHCS